MVKFIECGFAARDDNILLAEWDGDAYANLGNALRLLQDRSRRNAEALTSGTISDVPKVIMDGAAETLRQLEAGTYMQYVTVQAYSDGLIEFSIGESKRYQLIS